jgi:hypothetical protein
VSKKFVLALFVVGAIAVGLLVVLAIGLFRVDEDGGSRGAPPIGDAVAAPWACHATTTGTCSP